MFGLMLKIHNFVTAPLTDFFLHPKTCPPSVIFGSNFIDYFYIWFMVLLVCWSCVYYAFKKIMERLLQRIGLTISRARRTAAALWCAGAGLGAGLLSASQLEATSLGLEMRQDPEAMPPPPHVGMYLTVLATCQAQRVLAGCLRRGVTRHTLAGVLQLAILPASYLARWPELGFSVTLLLSGVQVLSELARLCLSFNKGLFHATLVLFGLYCAVWSAAYVVTLPLWLMSVVTTPVESHEHQTGLAFLFLALAGHTLVSYILTPLFPSLLGWLRGAPAAEWLETSLFPEKDRAMQQMRVQARDKRNSMEAQALARRVLFSNFFNMSSPQNESAPIIGLLWKSSINTSPKRKPRPPPKPSKPDDAKALIQTIRCVTLLKRKIRSMREKKAQLAEADSKVEEQIE